VGAGAEGRVKLSELPPNVRAAARAQMQPRRKKSAAEREVERRKARAVRDRFFAELRRAGIAVPAEEVRFHDARRYRFDFAWPAERLALEVDGGIWTWGAHGRGAGIERDQDKTNLAAALGWRVMRTTPRKLCKPVTIALIRLALEA
jgi:very-short-patch-repair endonuclease